MQANLRKRARRASNGSAAALFLRGSDLFASAESLGALKGVGLLAGGRGGGDVVLDFSGHGREGRLDVLALLGGRLEEAYSVVVGHLLALFEGHGAAALQIGFVSHEDSRDVVLRVLLDLGHPGVHGVEGVAVRDIVHHDDAVRALVVRRSDGLKTLLAGSIPDLQFAHLLVHIDRADLEVDSDRGHEVFLELVVLCTTTTKSVSASTLSRSRA